MFVNDSELQLIPKFNINHSRILCWQSCRKQNDTRKKNEETKKNKEKEKETMKGNKTRKQGKTKKTTK